MRSDELLRLAWTREALGTALAELLAKSGLETGAVSLANPRPNEELSGWIKDAAQKTGCDVEQLVTRFRYLSDELITCYPGILRLSENAYLAVLSVKGERVRLIAPGEVQRTVPLAAVRRALRATVEASHRQRFSHLLTDSGLKGRKHEKALEALLEEQLSNTPFEDAWVFASNPGGKPMRLLKQAGVFEHAGVMLGAHLLQSLLWLTSWALLGTLSLEGHFDRAWVLAWALLLLTLVPCQVVTTWLQGLFAIGLGGVVKRRLLYGALKLKPEEMRQGGIGSFLGQALEAEALETLALSGGVGGLLALTEIALSLLVLGKFAVLLLAWGGVTAYLGWRFLRQFRRWTERRLSMTQDLVETMVGHRTRLAQLPAGEWHEEEDRTLQGYLSESRGLDRAACWLMAGVPRAWLLTGIACLIPAIANRQSNDLGTGIILGGVLLAYGALRKLTGAFADVGAAWVAFEQVRPLFRAAARREKPGDPLGAERVGRNRRVVEAERLTFRYGQRGKSALQGASLTVIEGDRILLEGPSGGGKSTFASLLAGIRQPESGLLLARGLDRETLGEEGWRRQIAAVPQFHENHILTETLAFNLLLGRGWPATRSDMEEAETICRDLGLGSLLEAMPSGLMQMVGEGGWQLSHGEKSRVFLARALLQSAEMVILDESFAALDPENAKRSLETTLERAKTLMVIAHP